MADFEITSPDGKKFVVTAPEGASQEQVLSYAQKQFSAPNKTLQVNDPAAAEIASGPGASMGTGERFLAGMGSAVADLGRGAGQMVGAVSEADVADARQREEGLGTAGKVGKFVGSIASFVPALAIPGANTLVGSTIAGAAMGLLSPTAEGESRTINTALGGAGGAVGKVVGDKVAGALGSRLASKEADLATSEAQNSGRDAILAAARAEGLVIPPSSVNSGNANRIIESLGGKAATAQQASKVDQGRVNTIVRRGIGLPADTHLDEVVLAGVRENAGKAYEAIKSLPTRFQSDIKFMRDINDLGKDFAVAAKEFPEIAKNEAVDTLQSALSRPDMSPTAAIELIKKLRFDAGKNFKAFDDPAKAALAKAQRSAAEALETLVERNLKKTGQQDLITDFRNARTLIAKVHDVESALLPDGNISLPALAKAVGDKGKGDLQMLARFAGAFPRAAQTPSHASGAGVSNLFGLNVGLGGLLGGIGYSNENPSGALLGALPFVVPPAARSLMLSKAYQNLMATPRYSVSPAQSIITELAKRGAPSAPLVGAQAAIDF